MKHMQDTVIATGTGAIPVAGCVVAVFVAGTSFGTPATIYASNSLSNPISGNAVTTNQAGAYSFYATNGRYDLTFTYNGVQVATQLDVLALDIQSTLSSALPGVSGQVWNNGGAISLS